MNRSKYIVFDTETADLIEREDDKVDPTNAIVYNIGWQVIDKYGEVYERRSFLVKEVMFAMRDRVRKAFYASKIPLYWDFVGAGLCEVDSLFAIRDLMIADILKYECVAVMAHNARFDVCALNSTIRVLTESEYTRFLPAIEVWDTLKMAHDTIAQQPTYRKFCENHGFMTKHSTPRPRETAEVLYRYMTANPDFEEEHTALADVEIESAIFWKIMAQHKKMDKVLYPAE